MTIYRLGANTEHLQLPYCEQDIFYQVVSSQHLEDYGLLEDTFLAATTEREKATTVVVKRGRTADIMREVVDPPYEHEYDIRALSSNMTWFQIRENYTEGGASDYEADFKDLYEGNAYEMDSDTSSDLSSMGRV